MAVPVTITDLAVDYGRKRALHSVSLECAAGELTALVGPSGCGKTTLLRSVAGFQTATSGSVRFGDRDVTGLGPQKRRAGMVFQQYALWPHLTVFDNVAYGLKLQRVAAAEREERVMEVLRKVEIDVSEVRKKHPQEYSGGQQQRIALARALVTRPDVLLFDEPLSALDAQVRTRLRDEIRDVQQSFGITALYVTHDQEEALAMADQVVVMRDGRIEQAASPEAVYAAPATPFVAQFLGDTSELVHPEQPDTSCFVRASDVVLEPAALSDARRDAWRLGADGSISGTGTIIRRQYLGSVHRAVVRLDLEADGSPQSDTGRVIIADTATEFPLDRVQVTVPGQAVHRFAGAAS